MLKEVLEKVIFEIFNSSNVGLLIGSNEQCRKKLKMGGI